jgi:carboxyl-terminal processing protease
MRARPVPRASLVLSGAIRPLARLACVAAVVVIVSTATAGGVQVPALETADRLVVASRLFAVVQQHFAHWEAATPSEVDASYRQFVTDAIRSSTRAEFTRAALRFVASLRNGHTQLFDSHADGRSLKFRLLEVEGQWVVVASGQAGLARGSVIRAINGEPVEAFIREAARYVHASNDRLARTHVSSYPLLFPERVVLETAGGVAVLVDRATPESAPASAPPRASEGRWLREGQVAYIRVPSFGEPVYEETAMDLVRRFSTAPTLVVDVRGNGGGATPGKLIAALMNRPWRTWQEVLSHGVALGARTIPPTFTVRESRPQTPTPGAYAGQLFLLVDRFCGSACEDFVMPFKDTGRGVLVGETTQGSSGNPYRADLGEGISVAVGAKRYRFPDGQPFEGVGIAPDVLDERRISNIAAGRDHVLERVQLLTASDAK